MFMYYKYIFLPFLCKLNNFKTSSLSLSLSRPCKIKNCLSYSVWKC